MRSGVTGVQGFQREKKKNRFSPLGFLTYASQPQGDEDHLANSVLKESVFYSRGRVGACEIERKMGQAMALPDSVLVEGDSSSFPRSSLDS